MNFRGYFYDYITKIKSRCHKWIYSSGYFVCELCGRCSDDLLMLPEYSAFRSVISYSDTMDVNTDKYHQHDDSSSYYLTFNFKREKLKDSFLDRARCMGMKLSDESADSLVEAYEDALHMRRILKIENVPVKTLLSFIFGSCSKYLKKKYLPCALLFSRIKEKFELIEKNKHEYETVYTPLKFERKSTIVKPVGRPRRPEAKRLESDSIGYLAMKFARKVYKTINTKRAGSKKRGKLMEKYLRKTRFMDFYRRNIMLFQSYVYYKECIPKEAERIRTRSSLCKHIKQRGRKYSFR